MEDRKTPIKAFLEGFGISYFEDDDRPIEDIYLTIENFIMSTEQYALHNWEERANNIEKALGLFEDNELDDILQENYGIYAHKVGGGRKFFQRLHDVMAAALNHKKHQTDQ